jgi:hypothetical protein
VSKILKTAINEIAWISGDNTVLEHPLSDLLSFDEIKQVMKEYEQEFPQFKNFRFVERSEYTKSAGSRFGVTREWYDLVADYNSKLLEELD